MHRTYSSGPAPAVGAAACAAERLGTVLTTQPASFVKAVGPLAGSSGHLLVTAGGCVISAVHASSVASGVLGGSGGSPGDGPGRAGVVNVKGASHMVELLQSPGLDAALQRWTDAGEAPTLASLESGRLAAAVRGGMLAGHSLPPTAMSGGPPLTPPPSASMRLTSGLVASLDLVALPSGHTALGVVGTTRGTLCAFLLHHEGPTLVKLCETELAALLAGAASARGYAAAAGPAVVSSEDTVRDVALAMDPAGRPEVVVCATATCVAVVDVLDLQPTDGDGHDHVNEEEEEEAEGPASADTAAAGVLGAERVSASRRQHQRRRPGVGGGSAGRPFGALRRDRCEPLGVVCAGSEVVRVLVPQRRRAAFAADVAAVVVLAGGTVRYVERIVAGGSVRVLLDYHRARQQLPTGVGAGDGFTSWVDGGDRAGEAAAASLALLADPHTIPHVAYAYRLSDVAVSVTRLTEDGASYHDAAVTVNDAALFFNARVGRMDLVLAGTRESFLDAGAAGGAGGGVTAACARQAWWAVARGVVLPHRTLHSLLGKEAYYGGGGGGGWGGEGGSRLSAHQYEHHHHATRTMSTTTSLGPPPSLHTVRSQSGCGLLFRSGGAGATGGVGGPSPAGPTAAVGTGGAAVAVNALASVTVLSCQNDVVGVFAAGSDLFALSLVADGEGPTAVEVAGAASGGGGGGGSSILTENEPGASAWAGTRVLRPPRHVLATEVTIESVSALTEYRVGSSSAALMCVATRSTLSMVGL